MLQMLKQDISAAARDHVKMPASIHGERLADLAVPVLYSTAWSEGRSLVSRYVFTLKAKMLESIARRMSATAMGKAQTMAWLPFVMQQSRITYASGLAGLTAPSSAAWSFNNYLP